MDKKKIIGVGLIILALVLIFGVWFFMKPNKTKNNSEQAFANIEAQQKVIKTVSNIPEINPFKVDVNPYKYYINPFAKK